MLAKLSYRIPRLGRWLLKALAIGAFGICLPVQAAVFTQTLDFHATDQSVWGPGGSIGFDFSNSYGFTVPILDVDASVGYSIGASSGQVSAGFKGDLSAAYMPTLASPGTTFINLGFQGQGPEITWTCLLWIGEICVLPFPIVSPGGGQLTSTLGAHAQLTSTLGDIGPDLQLDINKGFVPQLDQTVSGSDSEPNVAQIPIVNLVIGSAGVSMGVTQTDSFTATAINGFLHYSLEGSGIVNSSPFTLPTDAGLILPVSLTEPGTWDFWFVDQTLDNIFSTSLDMDLGLFVNHPCFPEVWNTCTENFNLISPTIYSGDPFALAFNSISNLNGFSILVNEAAIPEPGTLALLGLGLAGLVATRRRKH
jgi:hypothetical protein